MDAEERFGVDECERFTELYRSKLREEGCRVLNIVERWWIENVETGEVCEFESKDRQEMYRKACGLANETLFLAVTDTFEGVEILVYHGRDTRRVYRVLSRA